MALPGNISVRTVTGKYSDFTGNPIAGQVTFTIPQVIIDAAAAVILIPTTVVATLDTTGAFSVTLPVTDDSDLNPLNYQYTVVESFVGGRTFQISIPTAGGVLDLSTVAPSSTFILQYILVSAGVWAALVARITAEEALFNTSIPSYKGETAATISAKVAAIAAVPSPFLVMGV